MWDIGKLVTSSRHIEKVLRIERSESAATLEAESGYTMEAPEVSQFRDYVLNGLWTKAEAALKKLGVREPDQLMVCVKCSHVT